MRLRILLSSLTLACLLFSSVMAQSPSEQKAKDQSPAQQESEQKANQELEQKSLALLEDVIADIPALKLPENRTLAQATAADLLWKHDEKRARALFRDALSSLGELKPSSDRRATRYGEVNWMAFQLRQQVLQAIARRDAQMALDYLRATRRDESSPRAESLYQRPDPDLLLEQSLAAQVAANNPKLALQLAEESLAKGLSHGVIPLLLRLQEKDKEAGAKLASAIIKKLGSENFTTNPEAANLALSLVRMSTRPEANMPGLAQEPKRVRKVPPVLDEANLRELIDTMIATALSSPSGSPIFYMLPSIMPEVEKYAPARLPQLRSKLAEFRKTLDPQTKMWTEYESLLRNGTTEKLLEAAAKAPPEMRNALYHRAAWQAVSQGDGERARQIINDNLPDSAERKQMLADIDRQLLMRATTQGKLEEARLMLSRINSKNDRATALAQLAVAAVKKDARKLALQLLTEAYSLVSGRAKNDEQLQAQLKVAHAYALVEPARSFELIEPLIAQANEMIAAAAVLDGFGAQQGFFRRGELVLTPAFLAANGMYSQYSKDIPALARADFERTKAAANKFDRSELRLMARLLVAQGILSDKLPAVDADSFVEGEGMLIAY